MKSENIHQKSMLVTDVGDRCGRQNYAVGDRFDISKMSPSTKCGETLYESITLLADLMAAWDLYVFQNVFV